MYSRHRGAGPSNITSLTLCVLVKIILADFNLAVSTPTAKLPNLIFPSNFSAVWYSRRQ